MSVNETGKIELVGKIGSMALIDREHAEIDVQKFARIGKRLRPGMVWVTSGAVEIGRIDYQKRNGCELTGAPDAVKTDYASQGQAILMQAYRNSVPQAYSIRQILVEHQHFNDEKKRAHIRDLILRAASQNAIPIVNYNDAVSVEENRKLEIQSLRANRGHAVELVDNDETASQIACLVSAKTLLILTTLEGIYTDVSDRTTLIREICAPNAESLFEKLDAVKRLCVGASRAGANGAFAKLEYIKPCVKNGTRVIIASAQYDLDDILDGTAPSTTIAVR